MVPKITLSLFIILSGFNGLPFKVVNQAEAYKEENQYFERFLTAKLQVYNAWLSLHDPLPAIVEPVSLKTNQEGGDGVDADFTITNHYMSGHSKPYSNDYYVLAELNLQTGRRFMIGDSHDYQDQLLILGGVYRANGTILVDSRTNVSVPFQGQGKWRLKANLIVQAIRLINYTISEDVYIDIDSSLETNYEYRTSVSWNKTDYEGLRLNDDNVLLKNSFPYKRRADEELKSRIQRALTSAYESFLKTVYQYPIKHQPYKRVLVEYLKEIFSETKLSDITPGSEISTSAITSTNPSVSTGGGTSSATGAMMVTGILMLPTLKF